MTKTTNPKPAPFSLRLTEAERRTLIKRAGDQPLGTYIRNRILQSDSIGNIDAMIDKLTLAQILALLGQSQIARHLEDLARAVRRGAVIVTPETESKLTEALLDIRRIKTVLMNALNIKER